MRRRVVMSLPVVFLMVTIPAPSQESEPHQQVSADSQQRHPDTLLVQADDRSPASLVMTKSPGLAVGLSAILPGAGQFYNESYWKIPIVVGLGGYFVAEWISNDNLAEDYRVQYEESKTEENPSGDAFLLASRDFYKQQRDTFVWYFVILYVANLVDAYVDANLYDFNVGEDLSIRVLPEFKADRRSAGLGFVVRF